MIGMLTGRVESVETDTALIDVGGVGYEVRMSATDLSRLHAGQDTRVFTYMNLSQDAITLHGFLDQDAKKTFLQLIKVSGIGPKVAQSLLSTLTPSQLAHAIADNDATALAKAPGLGKKGAQKIIRKLDVDEDTFNEVISEITKLNPRPGASLGETIGRNLQQIIPDFIVETYDDGTINVSLNNRNVPELRMSRDFTEMVEEHTKNKFNQTKESKEAMMFLKQKMDAAQGFIDAIKQRQNTLMTTMQAIIDLQRPFFLEGDESLLKPMILKDVAERTGLDISTISRVSNSKYVQTNFGIYQLKFFFVDGYTTEDGEEMSVREIRKILKECIDSEDKKKPLTDDELAEILKEKGYPIARRTVAKYRQQLNIPVARLRK